MNDAAPSKGIKYKFRQICLIYCEKSSCLWSALIFFDRHIICRTQTINVLSRVCSMHDARALPCSVFIPRPIRKPVCTFCTFIPPVTNPSTHHTDCT